MSGALGTFGSIDNPLMQFLNQYAKPAEAPTPQTNSSDTTVFEVKSIADLDYVDVPTGSKRIVLCENEEKVYVGRHNFITGKPDWQSYVKDEEIKSVQTNTYNYDMPILAQAMVQIGNKLDTLHEDIRKMAATGITRGADGKFKKAGA